MAANVPILRQDGFYLVTTCRKIRVISSHFPVVPLEQAHRAKGTDIQIPKADGHLSEGNPEKP